MMDTAREKIEKNFLEFLRNGSGWIFDWFDLVSVHIAGYDAGPQKTWRKKQMRENKNKKSLRKCFNLDKLCV